jgi:hypothetical protein
MTLIIALIAMGLGALWCFFGWRFFLLLLPIWGLFVGFNVGTEAVAAIFGQGTFATLTSWAVGLVLAVVFAVLAWFWWYFAVALLAGSVGFALGQAAWGIIGSETGLIAFALGLVLAVVFAIGVLALNVPRLLVIVLSGLGGSAAILAGWFILTGAIPSDSIRWVLVGHEIASSWFYLIVWAVIAGAGMLAQLKTPEFGPTQYEYSRTTYRYGG